MYKQLTVFRHYFLLVLCLQSVSTVKRTELYDASSHLLSWSKPVSVWNCGELWVSRPSRWVNEHEVVVEW